MSHRADADELLARPAALDAALPLVAWADEDEEAERLEDRYRADEAAARADGWQPRRPPSSMSTLPPAASHSSAS